jgi:hypothetical protein
MPVDRPTGSRVKLGRAEALPYVRQVPVWACIAAIAALTLGAGLGVAGQVFRTPQGTAENLRFEQAAGGVITITYDLRSDDANAVFTIVLEVTNSAGTAITPSSTTGDIGPGVRPGTSKRIVWSASRDVEDLQVGQFKFNIRASAGTGVPVTPATRVGRLIVNTTPPGAIVYVDGQSRGVTPLTLTDVVEGTHTVRVVLDGYLDNQRSVAVTAGSDATITAALTAAAAAPRPAAPASTAPSSSPPTASGGGGSSKWLWIGLAGAGAGVGVAVAGSGGGDNSSPNGGGGGGGTGGGGGSGGGTTPPVTCQYGVTGLSNFTAPAGGQTATRRVAETNAPCTGGSWTASSTQPWLTVAPTSGSAAADVTITAAANTGASRTASLTVAGTTVQVAQDAPPPTACTFRANFVGGDGVPPGSQHTVVPGDCAGSGCGLRHIDVQASAASCTWTVDGAPSWFAEIELPAPGSRTIRFQVYERNTTGRDRDASFRVAGVPFTVRQCAGRCQ